MVTRKISRYLEIGSDIRGSVAIEAALVIPVVFLIGATATDFSFAILSQHQAFSAAHAGVLYAAAHGAAITNASAQIQAACQNLDPSTGSKKSYVTVTCSAPTILPCACSSGSTVTAVACSSTCSGGSVAGTYVTQRATATYTPIFSSILGSSPTYTATATARVW